MKTFLKVLQGQMRCSAKRFIWSGNFIYAQHFLFIGNWN